MDDQLNKEINEDLSEFEFLYNDIQQKINSVQKQIPIYENILFKSNQENIEKHIILIEQNLKLLKTVVDNLKISSDYQTEKNRVYETFRHLFQLIACLSVTTDYQSPTYDFAVHSMAGRQTGKIEATINDYKRDQHQDAIDYENKFLKEYIDTPLNFKFPIHVNLVHSGMGAFTTIFNFLLLENKLTGPVLVGKDTYFESKDILKKALGNKYTEADEADTYSIIYQIQTMKPCAIFIDTIGNTPRMHMPNLEAIINAAAKQSNDIYFVLDNSAAGPSYQLFKRFGKLNSKLHLISYESLNKFHQFGMDRTLGGIIISTGKDTHKIFDYRVHLGTNISDIATMMLPTPNRKIMIDRLERLERNTIYITQELNKHIQTHKLCPIEEIIHPSIPTHPNYQEHLNSNFHGAFLMLKFKKQFRSVRFYQRFISKIMMSAKQNNIPLAAGTSFGLPITRIYLTAFRAHIEEPFVRISPGTETLGELQKILNLILF